MTRVDAHHSRGQRHLAFWLEKGATSFVYVLQGQPGTPIKVGLARDVPARIAQLQTGNPQRLCLLEVVPGDRRLEWNFHRRLRSDRVLGEWFQGYETKTFLLAVLGMADAMVNAAARSDCVPDYMDFGEFDPRQPPPEHEPEPELEPMTYAQRKRQLRKPRPMTVRFVEPDPVVPAAEAQRMRESVRGCSVGLYAGPAHPLYHKRISPNPAHFQ